MDKKIVLTSLIISLSIMSSKSVITKEKTTQLQNEDNSITSIEIYIANLHEIGDPGDYEPE